MGKLGNGLVRANRNVKQCRGDVMPYVIMASAYNVHEESIHQNEFRWHRRRLYLLSYGNIGQEFFCIFIYLKECSYLRIGLLKIE